MAPRFQQAPRLECLRCERSNENCSHFDCNLQDPTSFSRLHGWFRQVAHYNPGQNLHQVWEMSEATLTNVEPLLGCQVMSMEMQSKVTGEGEPLVLVPGGLTGWLSWEPHAERLSATRKVVRTQLLNVQYGLENGTLPSDYSVRIESQALETTFDKLGLTMPLDLVAWSYGAAVTLDYALGHPERVRSLTLIEPPALWVLRAQGLLDAEAKETMAMLQTLNGDISELQLEQFMRSVGFVPPGKSAREMPQWPLFVKHRQSLRNSPAVVEHNDDPQRLRDFKRPVLLVKGTGSAQFLHQIIDALAATLPKVQVIELPAGHAPQVVSIDRFLERLATFQAGANS